MPNNTNKHPFDLEQRSLNLAKRVRDLCKTLPKTIINKPYIDQILRSSSSIGANYIEANEALSKKDFLMRIRISRKETKETRYWLELIEYPQNLSQEVTELKQELTELLKIFSSIIDKSL